MLIRVTIYLAKQHPTERISRKRISIFTNEYNVINHVTHRAALSGVVNLVDLMENNFGSDRIDLRMKKDN